MAATSYQEWAEKLVERSAKREGFAYTGDLPLGETWAITLSAHRDSDILSGLSRSRLPLEHALSPSAPTRQLRWRRSQESFRMAFAILKFWLTS